MATPRRRELSQEEVTPVVGASAKPKPKPAASTKPWWWYFTPAGIKNEATFRAGQVQRFNAGYQRVGRVGIMPIYQQTSNKQIVGLGALPSSRQALHATAVQAPTNAALAGINLAQRATNGWRAADPESTPLGQGLVQLNRGMAKALGAKLPEEMSPDDKGWFSDLPSSAATGAAVTPLASLAVPATAFGWAGGGVLSQALRWTSGIGLESFAATLLDDNTGGNIANAIDPNGPFAVKPEDDRLSASLKSLLPQAGVELALGGAFLGLSKTPGIARNLREHRMASEVADARASTVQAGIQEEVAPGQYEFRQAPQSVAQAKEQLLNDQPPPEIPSQEMAPGGRVTEGQLPDGDPAVDPWDPTIPEIDTAVIGINRLDDARLQELAAAEGPVLPEIERHLQGQQGDFQLEEGLDGRLLSAPTESLAPPLVPFADQLASAEVPHNTLMSLAHPSNSKTLHDRVVELTGRDFEEFTRADVIDAARSLEQEGLTFIPSRLQEGQQLMEVGQIRVDPPRFQFKEGVDAQGRQAGNSLDGVQKWDTAAEGRIQVWQDPADGNYYVVNGHNRVAKAKELGIPTLPVEMLIANNAAQARALGAITNIKQGMGTPFDAAKMMRELNIADAAGLEAAGMPLKSGTAAQGLALSKLPDNLFQQAVNGELPMGRALALGGSGLDAEGMIRVNQLAQGRDMSERAFAELTQMASTAPRVESAQGGLFGPDMIDTTVIKAELAAKVRADLISNKNLFKKVGKKRAAQALADKAGTTVDQGQAANAADIAQAVLGDFDATKYAADTPLSQMLNEGAAEIAGGAKPAAIAKRILAQLEAAAEASPPVVRPAVEPEAMAEPAGPVALNPDDRAALRNKVIQQAVDNGEVRPSATPIPELPAKPMVDPAVAGRDLAENGLRPGSPAAQALMDEARLSAEYAQIDARRQYEIEKAQREAIGYDDMPLEEKKANGMLDGWEKPRTGAVKLLPYVDRVRAANQLGTMNGRGLLRIGEAEWRAAFDRVGGVPDLAELAGGKVNWEKLQQGIEAPEAEARIRAFVSQQAAPASTFSFPADLAKSKPRYGMATVAFESDLDRAAYILRDGAKKSKGEDRLVAALLEQGYNIDAIRKHGVKVNDALKEAMRARTGSARAPQQAMELTVTQQPFSGGTELRSMADPTIRAERKMYRLGSNQPLTPELEPRIQNFLTGVVQRIAGPNAETKFYKMYRREIVDPRWGGDGKRIGVTQGSYDPISDIVRINGMSEGGLYDLISTAHHESFHRVQMGLMNVNEMKAMETAFGKARLQKLSGYRKNEIATIEQMAVAFQTYAETRALNPGSPMEPVVYETVVNALASRFPNRNWRGTITAEVATKVFTAFEKVRALLEEFRNWTKGNGFTSVDQFFRRTYEGRIAREREFNTAIELVTQDQADRIAFLDRWMNDGPEGAVSDIAKRVALVDRQIADLKAKAIAGGC